MERNDTINHCNKTFTPNGEEAMIQSGNEYREKNRKRLQRFYERQKAEGKKRISILLSANAYAKLRADRDNTRSTLNAIVENAILEYGSDSNTVQVSGDIYNRLMAEKDKTGVSVSEIVETALNQRYGGQQMTHFKEYSAGHGGIPDVDDMSEDYLAAFGGPDPETPSDPQAPAEVEPADPGQVDEPGPGLETDKPKTDQGDPATDDTGGGDHAEPAAALMDQKPEGDDLIPDCTGREITRDERDKILVQVDEKYPGPENAHVRVDLLNRKGIPVYVKSRQYPYGGEWDRKKFTDNLGHAKKRLGVE
jgi:hypothetical protein